MIRNNQNPTNLIIFGFTGDLVKKKILPALYHLEEDDLLGKHFEIVGVSRKEIDMKKFKKELHDIILDCDDNMCDDKVLAKLVKRINLVKTDINTRKGMFELGKQLRDLDKTCGECHDRLFYFALAPSLFGPITQNLVDMDLTNCQEMAVSKLLFEKPFGTSEESSKDLIKLISKNFDEKEIYRIDHYLAKETVQNILRFRFDNPLIRNIWKKGFIKQIQITAAELIDIEDRVSFYEETGALKDVFQSHLLQLVALTTMNEPAQFNAREIRKERLKALKNIRVMKPDEVKKNTVRGQYSGYKTEVGNRKSETETYVALKLGIKDARWLDVPIYVRTGKNLEQKVSEIVLVFNDPDTPHLPDNVLTIRIQPNEGIALKLDVKKPGFSNEMHEIFMDYCYARSMDDIRHGAYEQIFVDALNGDQTLFPAMDEILCEWRFTDKILEAWNGSSKVETYKPGSWGPAGAKELLERDGNAWVDQGPNICKPHFEKEDGK